VKEMGINHEMTPLLLLFCDKNIVINFSVGRKCITKNALSMGTPKSSSFIKVRSYLLSLGGGTSQIKNGHGSVSNY
jgi:hypothetical protein